MSAALWFLAVLSLVSFLRAEEALAEDPLTIDWRTVVPLAGEGAAARRFSGLSDLAFTGPKVNDPFVLGEFSAGGEWKNSAAGVAPLPGQNAAIELFRGEDFEFEGTMTHTGFGGWFLLIGWNEGEEAKADGAKANGANTDRAKANRGSGYCISNFTTRTLRSPWSLTEIRDGAAVPHRTAEYRSLDWKREQPFKLTVSDQRVTLTIGKETAFQRQRLAHYDGGSVILGAYRTAYGPKEFVLNSARVRAAEKASVIEAPRQVPVNSITPVPEEFSRLDGSRVWRFNGQADYEVVWIAKDPGRLRLVSIQAGNAKGFRYSTWFDQFERDPVRLADGSRAWRCVMRFSNWSAVIPCLVQMQETGRLRLAIREWDPLEERAPKTAPAAFEGEGIITLVGERTEWDVRSALAAPNPLRMIPTAGLPESSQGSR